MLSRRTLFHGALAALPLAYLWRRTAQAGGFGPPIPDPDGIIDLPAGFSYRMVEITGDAMSDGYRVPGRADGMACFAGPGATLVLMRNHELSNTDVGQSPYGPGQQAPAEAYDDAELGGVTRVVLDATTYQRISSNLVLTGTTRNCAGGTSPWGWLSCEETTLGGHGYVFVCPLDAATVQPAQRVVAYGRFEHEAAAVDPATMFAYLTEDHAQSCFYRFVPDDPAQPFVGTLQALRVVGTDAFDTSLTHATGTSWPIAWVDIANPDPATGTVRAQGRALGAAIVRRGEGLWLDGGAVYFSSTSGGQASRGQIFRLDPDGDGGALTLLAQSTSDQILDYPDNITIAPWGDVFMAEDGGGEQYLRILHPDGTISDFAHNALDNSEFAGVCFSPDGRCLFVNIQEEGLTLAITGPFPEPPPPPPDDEPDAGPDDPPSPDAGSDEPDPDAEGGDEVGGCSAAQGGGDAAATALVVAAAAAALRTTRDG